MSTTTTLSLDAALQAQKALRDLAGLPEERFPMEAFVGMISDEVEVLRNLGHTDEQIAAVIAANSPIEISAAEIGRHYASPHARHAPGQ